MSPSETAAVSPLSRQTARLRPESLSCRSCAPLSPAWPAHKSATMDFSQAERFITARNTPSSAAWPNSSLPPQTARRTVSTSGSGAEKPAAPTLSASLPLRAAARAAYQSVSGRSPLAEGGAVEGVEQAVHACLVPVVDAGHAGDGKLHGGRQALHGGPALVLGGGDYEAGLLLAGHAAGVRRVARAVRARSTSWEEMRFISEKYSGGG